MIAVLLHGPAVLLTAIVVVITPLALAVADRADRAGRRAAAMTWARRLAIPAGAAAAVGFWIPPGNTAVVLAIPYTIVCALAGAHGVHRLVTRGLRPASHLATSAGLVFLAGGAVWLVAWEAGVDLLGFPLLVVALTAAHFHVAGLTLALVAGRAAAERGPIPAAIAVACVVGVPLTAAGIAGPRWLETGAAVLTAAAGLGVAVALVTARLRGAAGVAAWVAGCALFTAMVLAAGFALRAHVPAFTIGELDPLSTMLVVHGGLNVVGFAAIGLVAVRALPAPPGLDPPPMSRVAGGLRIGADFVDRKGLVRALDPAPRGQVDSLEVLRHAGLDPDRVAPAVRAFYERTADHALVVRPTWRFGFRTGARIWGAIARRLDQLQLPTRGEVPHVGLTSRIVGLDADLDGRIRPRAWVRRFDGDGRTLYTAVYSTHRAGDEPYMNIAFPLPAGNLTSILRMDGRGAGVVVSTKVGGDGGVWWVIRAASRALPIKLPLQETIEVWTADDPDAPAALRAWAPAGFTTIARHRLWLFGIEYLVLDYAMREDSSYSNTATSSSLETPSLSARKSE